jgi:hypothetical protein
MFEKKLHVMSSAANVMERKEINYTKAIAYGVNSSMIKGKNFTWCSIKEGNFLYIKG